MLSISLYYSADLVSENETSGYIFIHAEGGLNQQRIAVRMCSIHTIYLLNSPDLTTHDFFSSLNFD
jgi:hypothetical protein